MGLTRLLDYVPVTDLYTELVVTPASHRKSLAVAAVRSQNVCIHNWIITNNGGSLNKMIN